MIDQLLTRVTVDLLILGLACLFCFFLAWRDKRNVFLALLVPIIVLAAVDTYSSIDSLLGTSRANVFPTEQVTVLAVAKAKEANHLWYWDEEINQPRAVKVPRTKENDEQMEKIEKKLRQGGDAVVGFSTKEGPDGPVTEIIEYDFNVRFHNLKGGMRM